MADDLSGSIRSNIEQEMMSYPPSWFDKFAGWVDQLPGSNWAYYLGIGIFLLIVGAITQWMENPLRALEFPPISIITLFQIVYVLSLLDYLDVRAVRSLEEFRPIFKGNDSQFLSMKTRLTTLPSRPIALITLITVLVIIGMGFAVINTPTAQTIDNPFSAITGNFTNSPNGYYALSVFTLLWMINVIFIFRTFHQLRTINHIYTQHAEINLFQQSELYAFSKVSASIAIGLVLTSPIWMILDPGLISMGINMAFAILAIFIFISPLLGAHRLLKSQKDRLITESMQKKEALILDLFSRLEKNNLEEIGNLERALSSMEKAHNEIKRISTWPWQTDTLRQIIGALLLPVTIWMIQYFLSQLLSD
jgi:hypothetical protein